MQYIYIYKNNTPISFCIILFGDAYTTLAGDKSLSKSCKSSLSSQLNFFRKKTVSTFFSTAHRISSFSSNVRNIPK